MHTSLLPLLKSPVFWSAVCSWFVAQITKMLCGMQKTGRIDFQYLASIGGMPSAHSALVSGLATAVGLQAGFGSPLFVTTLVFALVIMFNAATVRRAAGTQARLLNEMVDALFREHRLPEHKLAELLGHTRLEVFLGAVVGALVALTVEAVAVLV